MCVRIKFERKVTYNAYDSVKYKHDYFDENTGGYLIVEQLRIAQGEANKQEQEKFEKERNMCITLAKNGYAVEYIKDAAGYDILLNGIPADLKKTSSHNNMLDYAKKAIYKQGAKIVVFEFSVMTGKIRDELHKMQNMGIKVKYFTSNSKVVVDL